MPKKRTGRYEDHPYVITGHKPVFTVARFTPEAFAAQYWALSPITCPDDSTVIVRHVDGVRQPILIEVPQRLVHEGRASE